MGVPFVFRPQAGAGHNTAWWPTEREPYERFVREHARVAHPTKVSWETERTDKVDVTRNGNAFDAKVRDVAAFTLLLSPDAR